MRGHSVMKMPRSSLVALSILAASSGLVSVLVASQAGAKAGSSQARRPVAECQARHLVGFPLGGRAAAGNLSNVIGIVNMGTSSCRLGGYRV